MVCQSGLLKRELTTIVRNLGQSYSLSKRKLSGLADYIILLLVSGGCISEIFRRKILTFYSKKCPPMERDCNHFLLENVYG